jgi:hypothetical protein
VCASDGEAAFEAAAALQPSRALAAGNLACELPFSLSPFMSC